MKKPKLSPAEWQIMEAIWELKGAPSVREVLEKKFPNGEKAYTTVQTIMNNLVKKGILKPRKIGLVNFYRPRFKRNDMVKEETRQLVSRVFHGSFPALVTHLIDSDTLTSEEILAIKKLLEEKESQNERE